MRNPFAVLIPILALSLLVNIFLVTRSRPKRPGSEPVVIHEKGDTRIVKETDPDLLEELNRLRKENQTLRKPRIRPLPTPKKKDLSNPLDREADRLLQKKMDAEFRNQPLLEVLERIREDLGMEFIYDPSLVPTLEKIKVTLSVRQATADVMLQLLKAFSDIETEYLNGRVWIKPKQK